LEGLEMKQFKWLAALALSLAATNDHAYGVVEPVAVVEDRVALDAAVVPLAFAPSEPVRSPGPGNYSFLVDRVSRANGVDRALVHAMIQAESSYDPEAVSPAGAAGLMQLMPETAKRYGVRDAFDPEQNLRGGVRHLKDLLAQFDGDVELAVAAYNAGPNAVIRAGHRVPPNPETTRYVPRVMEIYRRDTLER
jgi:soluble lytic murein transglycosylase-like protein